MSTEKDLENGKAQWEMLCAKLPLAARNRVQRAIRFHGFTAERALARERIPTLPHTDWTPLEKYIKSL